MSNRADTAHQTQLSVRDIALLLSGLQVGYEAGYAAGRAEMNSVRRKGGITASKNARWWHSYAFFVAAMHLAQNPNARKKAAHGAALVAIQNAAKKLNKREPKTDAAVEMALRGRWADIERVALSLRH